MSCFSKQKIFCNACGKGMLKEFPHVIGRSFKVCSVECLKEIQWRQTLSTLGSDYKLRNDAIIEEKSIEDSIIESI